MNYIIGLFQEQIDECVRAQEEIKRLESLEADLKLKKQVLEIAVNKADTVSDSDYFQSEVKRVYQEIKRVSENKEKQQFLHRELVRKIETIRKVSKEFE